MKEFIERIIAALLAIRADLYQHFALGAAIAAVSFIIGFLASVIWMPCTAAAAIGIVLAAVVVAAAAAIKEWVIDESVDYKDLAATALGGLAVIVPAIIALI